MTKRPRPLKRMNLPLREGYHVTLIVWRSVGDLRAMAAVQRPDDDAVFCEEPNGPCIGEVHIERGTPPELVAHEFRHAIDYYTYRVTTERNARMTQECVATTNALLETINETRTT